MVFWEKKESENIWKIPSKRAVISFSGGVADCIGQPCKPGQFGDMGPELGATIRKSLLCAGEYRLGQETIRATVIGAGSHSARLSGSTVFCRGVNLPVKNLPVAVFTRQEQERQDLDTLIAQRLREQDADAVVLALPGYPGATYDQVAQLAEKIAAGFGKRPVLVCLEADMAKALGQKLCLLVGETAPCLCIDRLHLPEGSFLDIGCPVGPALPVVIKTLVLEKQI